MPNSIHGCRTGNMYAFKSDVEFSLPSERAVVLHQNDSRYRIADVRANRLNGGDKTNVRFVRSLFVSDTHLGNVFSHPDRLCTYLAGFQPDYLYLVGDFIDGWELRRSWQWCLNCTQVVEQLRWFLHQGTVVRYVSGNHDDFLRHNPLLTEMLNQNGVETAEQFEHRTKDHRRYLVIHGDQFDDYGYCSAIFERTATLAYHWLLRGNRLWNRLFGGHHGVVSRRVKASCRTLAQHNRRFRSKLADFARNADFHGVICGHIHAPERTTVEGIDYCNTGDWLEHCSALIEHKDGRLELDLAVPHCHSADPRTRSSLHQLR
ncbi:MAG: UDP-2,3-diacylglucosamine diphosphatase [Planctomycetaceae bacterium]|nr:UDP-2,3-diacylglucosamine diphosphatase [Planctomycetaceae bacterium]